VEILLGIMAKLILGELAFSPGDIEWVLEQVSGIDNGIDLLLKRCVGFHGFPLEQGW
jgi:hypothetical protein